MSAQTYYWLECLQQSADDHGVTLTDEQALGMAEDIQASHENYGMAFYSPPASDRLNDIEREWKKRVSDLEKELERYRRNAETAIKIALRQHSDANVSIGEHGEVTRYGGRIETIQ